MKILQINSVCGIRSTGRICSDIAEVLSDNNIECKIAYGRFSAGVGSEKYAIKVGSGFVTVLHYLISILLNGDGRGSYFSTKILIKKIKEYNPDIIHVHNLHGHYVNYNLLYKFLAELKKPVIFTLHDCWNFTGNCTHFDYCGCEKWKLQCDHCEQHNNNILLKYWVDASTRNYYSKKNSILKLDKIIVVPTSEWLTNIVKQSFLKEREIITIPSGIDLSRFQKINSQVKERYKIRDKKLILGVASSWTKYKGLEYFGKISQMLDENYQIALIGLTKTQAKKMPQNIICIKRTNNIDELNEWYTAADVFVNPTLQETQGLTNIEALACGTPVITFDSGGSPECIDEKCGIVVKRNDLMGLYKAIIYLCNDACISEEACIERSKKYDKQTCYKKYLDLYRRLISGV
jgi:putative colanic acid biosynthesis glycosyltransferase